MVDRVEEEEDPVLIFTAQKSKDNIVLITGDGTLLRKVLSEVCVSVRLSKRAFTAV